MKRIRSKNLADNSFSDIRKVRKPVARRIYLIILSIFCIIVVNHFLGGKIFLRANGIIQRDSFQVDAAYEMKITEVYVEMGNSVEKGDPIFKYEPVSTVNEMRAVKSAMHMLNWSFDKLWERLVETHEKEAELLARLDRTGKSRNPTDAKITEELQNQLRELQGNIAELQSEKAQMSEQLDELEERKNSLQDELDGDIAVAEVSGEIGYVEVSPGEVVLVGEKIYDMNYGVHYAMVFLPNEYMFEVKPGKRVILKAPTRKVDAVVERVLPIADVTPVEFHNSVRAPGRNQVVRVALLEDSELPINQQVRVRGAYFFQGSINRLVASVQNLFKSEPTHTVRDASMI